MTALKLIASGIVVIAALVAARTLAGTDAPWSAEELRTIASLRLAGLGPVPADPSNRVADDPRAARLGEQLFSDPRFSANGKVSCASCHVPARAFQDGLARAHGVGVTNRRTMPVAGTAWSPWQFWDGRKDSQWSQALGPLESAVEHGGDRAAYARLVVLHYRAPYEALFGPLPALDRIPASAGPVADPAAARAWKALPAGTRDEITRVFVNVGKCIAAYERTLRPAPSRFDRFADAAAAGHAPAGVLSDDERAGLRLFIGRAQCIRCHNGPRFTDDHFHNTGVAAVPGLPEDRGRAVGAAQAAADEFNCLGRWSDAPRGACRELEFMVTDGPELERAYKTPSLRDVALRAPYMHAGQVADLEAVVAHYDRAPRAPAGHSEIHPLHLSARERAQLVAFLGTLTGAPAGPADARGPVTEVAR